MSFSSFIPVRYSSLVPSTPDAFLSGRIAIPVCFAEQGVVTTLPVPARDFCSLTPDEALGFLKGLNRQVQGDQGKVLGAEHALIKTGFTELGQQAIFFAEAPDEAAFLPDNATWVLEKNSENPEEGASVVVLHNFDNGQIIRCEVDAKKKFGILTVTDRDLSTSIFVTPYEVAQGGFAFNASVKSLGNFLGLSARELSAKQKPVAEWMQRALDKIYTETFAEFMQQRAADWTVLPVDWQQGGGRIISGSINAGTPGSGNQLQPLVRMGLVRSGTTQVFGDRVEASSQHPPGISVEVFRPIGLGFPEHLELQGAVKNWVESIWRGE